MSIRAGSIVTRQAPLSMTHGAKDVNPCLEYIRDNDDHDVRLDVCVGMVIEDISGELEVIVQWLQMCPWAVKMGNISQEAINRDLLTEIGQIIPE